MGLFWSIQPLANQRIGTRIAMADSRQPVDYKIDLNATEEADNLGNIAVTVRRHILHPMVERTEIEDGRIRGTFFAPKRGCIWIWG